MFSNYMSLAKYACNPDESRGRQHKEKYDSERSPFLKDRDRIIHCMAFRRLEYKTQVFVNHVGDHYRTRLTHSLEVSQIARTICRELNLNEDLAETIALSHDLGHPPFGHAGEAGLNDASINYGGFDHNVQTIKILTLLEQRYAEFDGLNLTWETLEGAVKHNGPISSPHKLISELDKRLDLKLDKYASLEAQVAGLADDIAYCNHDIDDGIRAGMFKIEELLQFNIIKQLFESVKAAYPAASEQIMLNETIRRLVKHMVNDVVHQVRKNITFHKIQSVTDIRNANTPIAEFSPETEELRISLKAFLMEKVYKHYRVNRMTVKSKQVLKDLFERLFTQSDCLPTDWYDKLKGKDEFTKADIIKDYISGMTDRYAIEEHERLFNPNYF